MLFRSILLAVLFLVPGGIVSLPRRISQVVRELARRRGGAAPQDPSDQAPVTGPESTEKNKRKRQGQ